MGHPVHQSLSDGVLPLYDTTGGLRSLYRVSHWIRYNLYHIVFLYCRWRSPAAHHHSAASRKVYLWASTFLPTAAPFPHGSVLSCYDICFVFLFASQWSCRAVISLFLGLWPLASLHGPLSVVIKPRALCFINMTENQWRHRPIDWHGWGL